MVKHASLLLSHSSIMWVLLGFKNNSPIHFKSTWLNSQVICGKPFLPTYVWWPQPLNWWKGKLSGSIARTRKSSLWSCLSVNMCRPFSRFNAFILYMVQGQMLRFICQILVCINVHCDLDLWQMPLFDLS